MVARSLGEPASWVRQPTVLGGSCRVHPVFSVARRLSRGQAKALKEDKAPPPLVRFSVRGTTNTSQNCR